MSPFRKELKALSKIAWPLLIAQLTQTLMGVSDTVMAGRYNSLDMAAVAIGHSVTFPILIFMQGICLALSPMVARHYGGKRDDCVAKPVWQTFYLVISLSILVMLSILLMPRLLNLLEMNSAMRQETLAYVSFILLSAPAFAVYQTLRNYCEGLSKTRPTMLIMFTGLMVNIPANYILINGLFGLPEMGGAGCGLASMMVFYVMALVTFLYTFLSKSYSRYRLYSNIAKPDLPAMWAISKQGVPIALTYLAEVSLFAVVAILLAPSGAVIVASHQVALNFATLIFMVPMSIGLSVAIRIGHLIGEERTPVAKIAYKSALTLAVCSVVMTASFTVFGRELIASLYSNESEVIAIASSLLVFAAIFQFSDALQVVSANALRGYKDTRAMLGISIFCYWFIGLPVGLVLGLSDYIVPALSAKGFWIGFITGLSAAAVLMTWRVRVIQARLERAGETAPL